jgi:hypothetical protein
MYVIRLTSGNLLVPEYAIGQGGLIGDAYVEIGPDHADYARLAEQAITEQDDKARRRLWRDSDESLRREFLDYLGRHGADGGWHGD